MKYMGSKSRHASEIISAVKKEIGSTKYTGWTEPFVGGLGATYRWNLGLRFLYQNTRHLNIGKLYGKRKPSVHLKKIQVIK